MMIRKCPMAMSPYLVVMDMACLLILYCNLVREL